jgi:hypothetical protein
MDTSCDIWDWLVEVRQTIFNAYLCVENDSEIEIFHRNRDFLIESLIFHQLEDDDVI